MSIMRPSKRCTFSRRLTHICVVLSFTVNLVVPPAGYAQSMVSLPAPGSMVPASPAFVPVMLRGVKVFVDEPFRFDFLLDTGNTGLQEQELRSEATRLIKYFLTSLTLPEDQLWVNLSPYEKNRVIPDDFAMTEMGRDLLAQDYILKQLTASMIHPEDELGKKFWDRVYKKAYEQYGTTEIPINTFNKVWILPDKAVVDEVGNVAFVAQSHLKVMLDEDYLALSMNKEDKARGTAHMEQKDVAKLSNLSSQMVRELILPEIEKEVNAGKNFAPLRQIYDSLILAVWYKRALKESILAKVYVDQRKVNGVDVDDLQIKEKIYGQYLEAYKKGVYNFIKEDYDPQTQETISRRYFSGGLNIGQVAANVEVQRPAVDVAEANLRRQVVGSTVVINALAADSANRSAMAQFPNMVYAPDITDPKKLISKLTIGPSSRDFSRQLKRSNLAGDAWVYAGNSLFKIWFQAGTVYYQLYATDRSRPLWTMPKSAQVNTWQIIGRAEDNPDRFLSRQHFSFKVSPNSFGGHSLEVVSVSAQNTTGIEWVLDVVQNNAEVLQASIQQRSSFAFRKLSGPEDIASTVVSFDASSGRIIGFSERGQSLGDSEVLLILGKDGSLRVAESDKGKALQANLSAAIDLYNQHRPLMGVSDDTPVNRSSMAALPAERILEGLRGIRSNLAEINRQVAANGGKVLFESEFRDTTLNYFAGALDKFNALMQQELDTPEKLEAAFLEFHRSLGPAGIYGIAPIADLRPFFEKLLSPAFRAQVQEDPFLAAATVYLEFLDMKPFVEGSHRTASAILNWVLLSSGNAPFILTSTNIVAYKQITDAAESNDVSRRALADFLLIENISGTADSANRSSMRDIDQQLLTANVAMLDSEEFFFVARRESIGGNAGRSRRAVNGYIDQTGKIVAFGNIQFVRNRFADLDDRLRRKEFFTFTILDDRESKRLALAPSEDLPLSYPAPENLRAVLQAAIDAVNDRENRSATSDQGFESIVLSNVAQIKSPAFFAVDSTESMGGNTGRAGVTAVNGYADPQGKIVSFGNPEIVRLRVRDLDEKLARGELFLFTVHVAGAISPRYTLLPLADKRAPAAVQAALTDSFARAQNDRANRSTMFNQFPAQGAVVTDADEFVLSLADRLESSVTPVRVVVPAPQKVSDLEAFWKYGFRETEAQRAAAIDQVYALYVSDQIAEIKQNPQGDIYTRPRHELVIRLRSPVEFMGQETSTIHLYLPGDRAIESAKTSRQRSLLLNASSFARGSSQIAANFNGDRKAAEQSLLEALRNFVAVGAHPLLLQESNREAVLSLLTSDADAKARYAERLLSEERVRAIEEQAEAQEQEQLRRQQDQERARVRTAQRQAQQAVEDIFHKLGDYSYVAPGIVVDILIEVHGGSYMQTKDLASPAQRYDAFKGVFQARAQKDPQGEAAKLYPQLFPEGENADIARKTLEDFFLATEKVGLVSWEGIFDSADSAREYLGLQAWNETVLERSRDEDMFLSFARDFLSYQFPQVSRILEKYQSGSPSNMFWRTLVFPPRMSEEDVAEISNFFQSLRNYEQQADGQLVTVGQFLTAIDRNGVMSDSDIQRVRRLLSGQESRALIPYVTELLFRQYRPKAMARFREFQNRLVDQYRKQKGSEAAEVFARELRLNSAKNTLISSYWAGRQRKTVIGEISTGVSVIFMPSGIQDFPVQQLGALADSLPLISAAQVKTIDVGMPALMPNRRDGREALFSGQPMANAFSIAGGRFKRFELSDAERFAIDTRMAINIGSWRYRLLSTGEIELLDADNQRLTSFRNEDLREYIIYMIHLVTRHALEERSAGRSITDMVQSDIPTLVTFRDNKISINNLLVDRATGRPEALGSSSLSEIVAAPLSSFRPFDFTGKDQSINYLAARIAYATMSSYVEGKDEPLFTLPSWEEVLRNTPVSPERQLQVEGVVAKADGADIRVRWNTSYPGFSLANFDAFVDQLPDGRMDDLLNIVSGGVADTALVRLADGRIKQVSFQSVKDFATQRKMTVRIGRHIYRINNDEIEVVNDAGEVQERMVNSDLTRYLLYRIHSALVPIIRAGTGQREKILQVMRSSIPDRSAFFSDEIDIPSLSVTVDRSNGEVQSAAHDVESPALGAQVRLYARVAWAIADKKLRNDNTPLREFPSIETVLSTQPGQPSDPSAPRNFSSFADLVTLEDKSQIAVLRQVFDSAVSHAYSGTALPQGMTELKSGYARTAYRLVQYPNLVFKIKNISEFAEDLDPLEAQNMADIARILRYQTVEVDGFKLIKIDGIAPFIYWNGMVVQQLASPLEDAGALATLKTSLQLRGVSWTDDKLENAGTIDGRAVVIDNQSLRLVRSGPGRVDDEVRRYYLGQFNNMHSTNIMRNVEVMVARAKKEGRGPVRILDLGSGPDMFLLRILKERFGDQIDITGVDTEPSKNAEGYVRSDANDFIEDMLRNPSRPRFDMIISHRAFAFFSDPRKALESLPELLAPGGWASVHWLSERGRDLQTFFPEDRQEFEALFRQKGTAVDVGSGVYYHEMESDEHFDIAMFNDLAYVDPEEMPVPVQYVRINKVGAQDPGNRSSMSPEVLEDIIARTVKDVSWRIKGLEVVSNEHGTRVYRPTDEFPDLIIWGTFERGRASLRVTDPSLVSDILRQIPKDVPYRFETDVDESGFIFILGVPKDQARPIPSNITLADHMTSVESEDFLRVAANRFDADEEVWIAAVTAFMNGEEGRAQSILEGFVEPDLDEADIEAFTRGVFGFWARQFGVYDSRDTYAGTIRALADMLKDNRQLRNRFARFLGENNAGLVSFTSLYYPVGFSSVGLRILQKLFHSKVIPAGTAEKNDLMDLMSRRARVNLVYRGAQRGFVYNSVGEIRSFTLNGNKLRVTMVDGVRMQEYLFSTTEDLVDGANGVLVRFIPEANLETEERPAGNRSSMNQRDPERIIKEFDALSDSSLKFGLNRGTMPIERLPVYQVLKTMLQDIPDAPRIAETLARMQPGSIDVLHVFGLLTREERDILAMQTDEEAALSLLVMPPVQKENFVRRFQELVSSYGGRLKRVARQRMMRTLVPLDAVAMLAEHFDMAYSDALYVVSLRQNFPVWLPQAKREVDAIQDRVGGRHNAWRLVMQKGIGDNLSNWLIRAESEVERVNALVKSRPKAWEFVIVHGIENVGMLLGRASSQVDAIKGTVGELTAWRRVLKLENGETEAVGNRSVMNDSPDQEVTLVSDKFELLPEKRLENLDQLLTTVRESAVDRLSEGLRQSMSRRDTQKIMSNLQYIVPHALSNAVDSYQQMLDELGDDKDLPNFVFEVSMVRRQDKIIIRLINNGVSPVRAESSEEKRQQAVAGNARLGGEGIGLKLINQIAREISISTQVRLLDRMETLKDTEGAVLELEMPLGSATLDTINMNGLRVITGEAAKTYLNKLLDGTEDFSVKDIWGVELDPFDVLDQIGSGVPIELLVEEITEDVDLDSDARVQIYVIDRDEGAENRSVMAGPSDALGGISLDPANLNLQIRRDSSGAPLPMEQQPMENLNINGLVPIIINISPLLDIPMFLGKNPPPQGVPPLSLKR